MGTEESVPLFGAVQPWEPSRSEWKGKGLTPGWAGLGAGLVGWAGQGRGWAPILRDSTFRPCSDGGEVWGPKGCIFGPEECATGR